MSIIHHTKKPITQKRIRTAEEFQLKGQLISTLMRTFYEASVAEEEDRRRRRDRGDSAEDGAVDVHWPLSPSRTQPAGLLQLRLF
jgi:hypothetical protein